MEWKDLAPWIAIAVTLILSILVPLFTQIANNSHQRKMQREKMDHEQRQKKIQVYEAFLSDVGGLVTAKGYFEKEHLAKAGAALHQLYVYAPTEWYNDLDELMEYMMAFKWNEARPIVQKFSRLISEELNKH